MTKLIVVAGVGQLGSRYLQGLASYAEPLKIYAFDILDNSLSNAQIKWNEAQPLAHHSLSLISDISQLPSSVDLVIVASTASTRSALVSSLSKILSSPYWLLEKVLATSPEDLLDIKQCLRGAMTWVNTPRMYFPLFSELSNHLSECVCHVEYPNMSGLACNSIHLIDYFSRSINTDVKSVNVEGLDVWTPSTKRPSIFEVSGDLCVTYRNGSSLKIHGSPYGNFLGKTFTISIMEPSPEIWCISPSQNLAFSNLGLSIQGQSALYQSEITPIVIDDIFNSQSPLLPTLDQSCAQHLPFISALLSHWCDNMNISSSLPIT